MTKKTIMIGCDHAGYDLKENLKNHLQLQYNVVDAGTYDTESVNYPVFGKIVSRKVDQNPDKYIGVLICSTGIVGMSIVANRFSGVRAALVSSLRLAEMARKHNNANVLVFGATVISAEAARECCDIFLRTVFDGNRHQMRIDQTN